MKYLLTLVFAVSFAATPHLEQGASFDFDKLRLQNLAFISTKKQIINRLGQPNKIVEPNYECGFHSNAEQQKKYYQLKYSQVDFIGNAEEGYAIEFVKFNVKVPIVLTYGSQLFSNKTTISGIQRVFGSSVGFNNQPNGMVMASVRSKGDDGVIFWFKAERLVKFEYWTPC